MIERQEPIPFFHVYVQCIITIGLSFAMLLYFHIIETMPNEDASTVYRIEFLVPVITTSPIFPTSLILNSCLRFMRIEGNHVWGGSIHLYENINSLWTDLDTKSKQSRMDSYFSSMYAPCFGIINMFVVNEKGQVDMQSIILRL